MWSAFIVLPLFALANAGIPISGSALAEAAGSAVALGVAAGILAASAVAGTAGYLLLRAVSAEGPDDGETAKAGTEEAGARPPRAS